MSHPQPEKNMNSIEKYRSPRTDMLIYVAIQVVAVGFAVCSAMALANVPMGC
jgi:hypothetical protein